MINNELSFDARMLIKAINEQPELFPDKPFGISRIQRALKIGYARAQTLRDEAIKINVLKRSGKPWQVEVSLGGVNQDCSR